MRTVGIVFLVIMALIYISWYFDDNKVGLYGPEKGFTLPDDTESKMYPYPVSTPSIEVTDTLKKTKVKNATNKSSLKK